MTAIITKVTFNDDMGMVVPDPHPGQSQAAGDTFRLQFVQPHLMKTTIVHSSLPAVDVANGNPYWCGKGLAAQFRYYCGA